MLNILYSTIGVFLMYIFIIVRYPHVGVVHVYTFHFLSHKYCMVTKELCIYDFIWQWNFVLHVDLMVLTVNFCHLWSS